MGIWTLLQQHLKALGPGYYIGSNRPGDDMKDEVPDATATDAWQLWTDEWNSGTSLSC